MKNISRYYKRILDKREQKEMNRFAGYYTLKQTFLPGRSERVRNISKISLSPSKNQVKKDSGKPKFVEDMFWYLFLDKFQSSQNAQIKLFNRAAFNYVKLMLFVKNPAYRDVFFNDYPSLMSQSLYTAFCYCFPDSYRQFGEEFKEDLVALVYGWIAANTSINFDFLDSLISTNISRYASSASVSQSASNMSTHSRRGKGRNRKLSQSDRSGKGSGSSKVPSSSASSSSQEGKIPGKDELCDLVIVEQTESTKKSSKEKKSVDPRKLVEALTPIRETTFEDYESQADQGETQSEHSHPACKGADTVKSVYNLYGQSPLVAHFLRVKNLTRESGQTFHVQRTEQENLPPYPF
ncbi:F227A-like protein [Mya arenaria]|uniref:F227A-like protein n=1 Tax=Mya arenaria TaxID=6604 RepID=A0ABY7DKC1_MYAAR|nr:F227A-like protein [Mya arenaria]